nr:HAD family acid phosphatase [Mycoplasmopsis bovis]
MLIGSAPVILLPTIAATCENTATKSDQKDNKIYENTKLNTVLSSLKSTWETLKDNEKHDAIKTIAKAMKSDVKLSDDEVHYLISELNKDVGTFGGVVWYISSVESLIGKEQSYKFAKLAFDKLKESNKDKIDFGKKFMDNTSKIEADSNKSLPVVFMDIDETVLQNDLTEASAMINGGYSGATKEKNDLKANRFAIPGAVEFINYVHENGGLVFYNSDMNQSTAVRDAVKENLKKVGVKFVQDFQFWMRGSMPYLAENEAEISDEKTKDLSDDSLKKLANKLKFTTEYRETPWITSNKFFSCLQTWQKSL